MISPRLAINPHPPGLRRVIRHYLYRSWFGFVRVGRVEEDEYPVGHPLHCAIEMDPCGDKRFIAWLD